MHCDIYFMFTIVAYYVCCQRYLYIYAENLYNIVVLRMYLVYTTSQIKAALISIVYMKSSFNLDKYIYSANKQVGEILEICVRPINFRIPIAARRCRRWEGEGGWPSTFSMSLMPIIDQPVRLAGGRWLVLVCSERRVLLAGCW
jgi:hypothetical protein